MRIIAGEARGRKLFAPRDESIRPLLDQIRESIFSSLGELFVGGRVIDLFCGVGSFGLEALSRGASHAVFVDISSSSLSILKRNLSNLGFEGRAQVLRGDALRVPGLDTDGEPTFRVAFLDPPFKMFAHLELANAVFDRVRRICGGPCLDPDGVILLRHPSKLTVESRLTPCARKVYGESTVLWFRANSK